MAVVLIWAVAGLAVAAALNHLTDRLPKHQALRPGPACPACGRLLRRRQWLALLALLTGGTRCHRCGVVLPARRWLLEGSVAALYAILAWRHGPTWTLFMASFHLAVLILVTVTDLETRLVPNAAVLPAMAVTVLATAIGCPPCLLRTLLGGAVGFSVFLLLWALYPRGMGFGDVKLAGYVGLVSGYPQVAASLMIAITAGGIAAAALILSRRGSRKSYMAYAPYLALGGAITLFLL